MQVPSVGDRLKVYQYVHPDPTNAQIKAFIEKPWRPPFPGAKKLQCYPDWAVVCLRRHRKGDSILITITCSEFVEPLRSQGIKIPLENCEILERGYGLPDMAIEEATPLPNQVQVEHEQRVLFGA